MQQISIENQPLYERSNETLQIRDGNCLYPLGSYIMSAQITFTPHIGNIELIYSQREFNMVTLNNLSMISLFSEASNYKIAQMTHVVRKSSNVSDIMQEFNLEYYDCKYVIVPLSGNNFYIFIFEKVD